MDQDKFEVLRTAAKVAHPGYGGWLYDTWAALNHDYFDGELEAIALIWGRIGRTCRLSQFDPGLMRITLHTSLLSPLTSRDARYNVLDPLLAQDTLLHAMMHQAIYQRLGCDGCERARQTAHNNPAWVAEVRRIAPLLTHNVKACRFFGQCALDWRTLAEWPFVARSVSYYSPMTHALC